MKLERTATLIFFVSLAVLFASTFSGSEKATGASYLMTVFGGAIFAGVASMTAKASFRLRPPTRLIGWIFVHLSVWAAALALHEAGAFLWRQAAGLEPGAGFRSTGFLRVFEYAISPTLKVIQGAALAGLVACVWGIRKALDPVGFKCMILLVWSAAFLGSAGLLWIFGAI